MNIEIKYSSKLKKTENCIKTRKKNRNVNKVNFDTPKRNSEYKERKLKFKIESHPNLVWSLLALPQLIPGVSFLWDLIKSWFN